MEDLITSAPGDLLLTDARYGFLFPHHQLKKRSIF